MFKDQQDIKKGGKRKRQTGRQAPYYTQQRIEMEMKNYQTLGKRLL